MTVEDRVRAATRAIAGTVHDVRPLSLPSAPPQSAPPWVRGWHRWQRWAAPLAAAAAMAAIGIALAIVQNVPNGRGVSPSRPAASAGVPAYYVAIDAPAVTGNLSDWAIVGDTRTGARLATISPPAHDTFSWVTGAADDRTFVLGVLPRLAAGSPYPPPGTAGSQSWYLLRIAPGTNRPAQLTRLPIPATSAWTVVWGMALSPNGSEIAVASEQDSPDEMGPDLLQIYSVATGALLRTWSGPGNMGAVPASMSMDSDPNAALSWTTDGRTLAFGYGLGIRMLEVTRPGRDLIADSRLVFAMTQPGGLQHPRRPSCAGLVVTSDGKTVVCAAVTGTAPANGLEFPEYSTATGKLTGTLYRYRANYSASSPDFFCVLWASASGDTLVGCLNNPHQPAVGVFTQGKFTRLSFPLPGGIPDPQPNEGVAQPNAIAW